MKNNTIGLLFILLSHLIGLAQAHEQETLFNKVNIQARAEREIPNDQMIVLLATEHENVDTAKLANQINKDMQWALELVKNHTFIKSQTKSYQTYPTYKKQIIIGWRASQQLELKSENIEGLSEIVGKLQNKLQVKQMSFTPTRTTRVLYENELIEEALKAFKNRVAIVKKHMDNKDYRIINININTGGYQPPVIWAQQTMMKSMEMTSAPAVEAGVSKITVNITGSVQFY